MAIKNFLKKVDMFSRDVAGRLIRFYQYFLSFDNSPFLSKLGVRVCIYYPTCSEYTYQAIHKHGLIKGSVMGGARICRCNPLNSPGVDEVPEKFALRRNKVVNRE